MKDLTKGKPSRLILAFAIPIFMANILQLTYSIVDTRIVGSYLGENSLAAVGATTTLSNLMIGFLMGLANGFAIITAQKFGARDYAGVKKSFALSIKMGCIIALTITVLCLLFLRQILGFLNVSNDLMGMAVSYIFIIIAGLVATFLYDACAAALRALGDTVTPLVILAVSVCLNMAGDIFFVVVLKAGVAGAAIATVLAQVIAFIVCYVYMVKRYELLRLSRSDLFDSHLLRRHLKSSDENCDTEGAECKDSENNMTPEVIAVMKMTMLKAGLSHGIYEFTCKYRLADPADRHKPTGTGYYSSSHGCQKDIGDIHGHVYRVWTDNGDLLWAEYRSGRSSQSEKRHKTGNILYLHMVYDGNYRKLHYRPVAGEACNRH